MWLKPYLCWCTCAVVVQTAAAIGSGGVTRRRRRYPQLHASKQPQAADDGRDSREKGEGSDAAVVMVV